MCMTQTDNGRSSMVLPLPILAIDLRRIPFVTTLLQVSPSILSANFAKLGEQVSLPLSTLASALQYASFGSSSCRDPLNINTPFLSFPSL